MKGAVQGVATSTASSPVAKLPAWPPRAAKPCPAPASRPAPTRNTPIRLRPIASITQAVAATKAGEANWNPHPPPPEARAAISAPPMAANAARMPAV